jgi:hypothetical protein
LCLLIPSDKFYKKESQEKTLLQWPDFFLLRSPLDPNTQNLTPKGRPFYIVALSVAWLLVLDFVGYDVLSGLCGRVNLILADHASRRLAVTFSKKALLLESAADSHC